MHIASKKKNKASKSQIRLIKDRGWIIPPTLVSANNEKWIIRALYTHVNISFTMASIYAYTCTQPTARLKPAKPRVAEGKYR